MILALCASMRYRMQNLPVLRDYFKNDRIINHETALCAWIDLVRANHPARPDRPCQPCFCKGGVKSDSERRLSVGGTEVIDAKHFAGFQYIALGHLHRPQTLGEAQQIHYPGSLLKYSFSEADHSRVG